MNFNIRKSKKSNLTNNEININIEYSCNDENIENFINYINKYDNKIAVIDNMEIVFINSNDIIYFYSDKKYNYCKTSKKNYKVKSKLYELEKTNNSFLRISKSCVINVEHVESFNLIETGKIIVKFDDGSEEYVSRRKLKDIMQYLDERSV